MSEHPRMTRMEGRSRMAVEGQELKVGDIIAGGDVGLPYHLEVQYVYQTGRTFQAIVTEDGIERKYVKTRLVEVFRHA